MRARLFSDVAATLYNAPQKPILLNFIAGIGGRDVTPQDIVAVFEKAKRTAETGVVESEIEWIGLNRELV